MKGHEGAIVPPCIMPGPDLHTLTHRPSFVGEVGQRSELCMAEQPGWKRNPSSHPASTLDNESTRASWSRSLSISWSHPSVTFLSLRPECVRLMLPGSSATRNSKRSTKILLLTGRTVSAVSSCFVVVKQDFMDARSGRLFLTYHSHAATTITTNKDHMTNCSIRVRNNTSNRSSRKMST